MVTETKRPGFWACTTLILAALLAAASLWGPGMVNTRGGGDSPFLLQRTHQLVANLRAGVFPARWMPDAAYGLGYPFFSYYAALPYYLAGLLALIGLDLLTAIKLVQTLGFVAAALAMYGWMLHLSKNRWAAWLAAVAYTVAPFHLVNVYVRGDSLSEFYAFIFYPLILWGMDRISNTRRAWPWLALAYAGLLLTHNISAAIFSPFALLYLVMLAWRDKENRWRVFWGGAWALGFGFLLSAWFWLPAVTELGYVQLGPSTQDYFHYSRHFRWQNLVQNAPLFDYSTAVRHVVRSPFAMGLAQATLAALGGLLLLVKGLRRQSKTRWWFILLGLMVSTAMITPLSKPLWDHLPLLPVVQFPWRFLSVQALFAAAATTALIPTQPKTRNPKLVTTATIAALLVAATLISLKPDRLAVGSDDVTVERLQLYELFAGNIGTTIRYEWLPNTADPRPYTSDALVDPAAPPRAIPLDGSLLDAALVERNPIQQTWHMRGDGGNVAFPLFYWPGWHAQVDGEPVDVWPVEGSGYLALDVPPGEHTVVLQLGRTPIRAIAEITSLCALVALVVVLLRARPKVRWRGVIRYLAIAIFLLFVLMLLSRGTSDSGNRTSDLTMDFIHMPYLHHNPDGINFDGAARLASYTLSAEELAPGDTLTITLNWSQLDGAYTTTVRLISPAAERHDVEPLTEATAKLDSSTSLALRLPEDVPRGVYLLQLHVVGPDGKLRARTRQGNGQGTLYLRPVRVTRGPSLPPDVSVLAPFGSDIRLHAVTVSQLAADRLAVQLAWSTLRPIAANYAISLRLLDADGQQRVSTDSQPGYGFLPTSLWQPGELVNDRYTLALPDDLTPGASYFLEIVLYQTSTLQPLGQARVGDFELPLPTEAPFEAYRPPRAFTLPPLEHPLEIDLGGQVRLTGYDLEQEADALHLTLWWQALQTPQADYTIFVHLFDPTSGDNVTQSDAQPRSGTYPTSWWTEGEVVSETVTLSLADAPPGTYQLAVGMYDHTVTRLQVIGPDGQRLPDDRVILPTDLEVR
ncbi:MAG: YfhO family protein [Chloroflexi bacterium]|nr:YfhO family protein [Chloroflexota bacterium]